MQRLYQLRILSEEDNSRGWAGGEMTGIEESEEVEVGVEEVEEGEEGE